MICKNCGREIADEAKFCTYCGATASVEADAVTDVSMPVADIGTSVMAVPAAGASADAMAAPAAETGADVMTAPVAVAGYDAVPIPAADAGYDAAPMPAADAQPPDYGTAAQPAPYIAPEAAAQPAPYGAPTPAPAPYGAPIEAPAPYGSPPASPYAAQPMQPLGSPQTMYGAAPLPQTSKKSKTGLVVGIIIAAVVVLVAAVSIGGYFIYQNLVADEPSTWGTGTVDTNTTPDPSPQPTPKPEPTPKPDPEPAPDPDPIAPPISNDGPVPTSLADFKNPYVVLDTAEVKITIDVGSGTTQTTLTTFDVYCVVENKTDKEFGFFVENATGDGYRGSKNNVFLFKEFYVGDLGDFVPGENLAILTFDADEVDGKITNFKAKLILYDVETLDDIAEYDIVIPEL